MVDRKYYSRRKGLNPKMDRIDLDLLKELFYSTYQSLFEDGYFQEAMGYNCVDIGDVHGTMGRDIGIYFLRKLRKSNLWPIQEKYKGYTEDDLFDVIELLYDTVSKPIDGRYHDWSNCGWHYSKFEKKAGQLRFYDEMNEFLKDYSDGYEISISGEILTLGDQGLENLLKAELPDYEPKNVDGRINSAIHKFRRHSSSVDDKRDAVRSLADVFEYLRPKLQSIISSKDEADLFNIANNFSIRHHNDKQKNEYDESIWLSWMFYFYLATIHTTIRKLKKSNVALV